MLRLLPRRLAPIVALCGLAASPAAADLLYENDFEAPNGFVDTTGRDVSQQTVNALYDRPGFTFQQLNTVETLEINGGVAFGTGYSDPQGLGGNYVLGLLSIVQNDKLSLTFDVGSFDFLNVRLDLSAIDLDGVGGPFGVAQPVLRLSLFDSPGGAFNIGAPGTPLDELDVSGTGTPSQSVFDWTGVAAGLSAAASTDGNVSLVLDLLVSGYASFDNLEVEASNAPIPEPSTALLLGLGLAGLAYRRMP